MSIPLPVSDVIAALPLPALAIAPSEQVIAINPLARNLLDTDVTGKHFITILRQPSVAEAVEQCLADGSAAVAQYLARENGQDVTYDVSVRAIGTSGNALLTFQDINHVAVAGQMRRDFVANVSHELRSPLTALMGFIETLRGPARDDATVRDRFLSIMTDEADRMNRLVGDLLSLSRVEAAERVRPTEQVDLGALLSTTLRNLGPLGVDAGVTFNTDLPEKPVMVLGDKDQLLQVFTNLVGNAVKYGSSGKIVHITMALHAQTNVLRAPGVEVCVRDEGPGIDPVHLPRLTERFYRIDSHRNRSLGGTGLGLAIVKHILNRHRGRLKIASKPGQGAEFRVFLPLA